MADGGGPGTCLSPVPAVLTPIERPRRSRRVRSESPAAQQRQQGPSSTARSRAAPARRAGTNGDGNDCSLPHLGSGTSASSFCCSSRGSCGVQPSPSISTQAALEEPVRGQRSTTRPVKPTAGVHAGPGQHPLPEPPEGTVMAHLQIPKIGLDEFVVSGTNEGDLAKGPGHYLGTAMPGQAGNVAIAGHRTTHGAPFNRLAELAIGDPFHPTAANRAEAHLRCVGSSGAVSPTDVTVLNNFGDDRITLTTCNPEFSAIQRLIVVAAYLPPGGLPSCADRQRIREMHTPGAGADSADGTRNLLPLVAIELAALVALGLLFRIYPRLRTEARVADPGARVVGPAARPLRDA